MLDAFIIEQLKKQEEEQKSAWQPLPLELPLPENDNRWQDRRDSEEEKKEVPRTARIAF